MREISISFLVLIIFGFLILSAFFSGSETAFFSLTKIQLKKLEKNRTSRIRRIFRLLKNPRELLIIILLGNTIVNVAASSTAALIAIRIGDKIVNPKNQPVIIFLEIMIMTFLLLLFGEISPKLYAFSAPVKIAGFSGFILEMIKYLFWPVVKALDLISYIFSRKKPASSSSGITSEDFRNLINSKSTQSSLEENEKKIIASIFKFSSTTAREIMRPRVDIVALEVSEGLTKLKNTIISCGHSKIPIYKKNVDNIIGIIYAKDIILNPEKQTINSLLRPCLFVTENVKIQSLLNQFKSKKIQIAIVVDEYGGTSGLITLEDILEELVGEIMDEYDREKPMITKINELEYQISGMYSISDLNQRFYLDLDEEEYANLAELLFDKLNKVPHENETYIYKDRIQFTITNIKAQRINEIRMKILDNYEISPD
ncbi:MAG: HlyC/CorC family transporter [Candidatus Cloacimonetes bacterium]|nr:HlyC/CorC family transporter [Candidatus Cloacimonadota bacterium]